jgi:hypothetical protein
MWNPQDSLTASQLQPEQKDSIPSLKADSIFQSSIIQESSVGLSIQDEVQQMVLELDDYDSEAEEQKVEAVI